jgi:hypothetical protein
MGYLEATLVAVSDCHDGGWRYLNSHLLGEAVLDGVAG